jgi:hypothetical protein
LSELKGARPSETKQPKEAARILVLFCEASQATRQDRQDRLDGLQIHMIPEFPPVTTIAGEVILQEMVESLHEKRRDAREEDTRPK